MATFEAFLSDAITNGRRDLVIVPEGATAPASHTSIGEVEKTILVTVIEP